MDGSSLGNPGRAGYDGIVHNSDGAWLCGFFGSIGIATSLQAKLWALYHGLNLAWNRGFRDVICYSDSQTAISLVKDQVPIFHHCAALIKSVQDLLRKEWFISLHHTLREGNQCADYLAKMGANQHDGFHLLVSVPSGISSILLTDSCGVNFLRM